MDPPSEFYRSINPISAGNSFSPSWILVLPTALFQVLFLTHANLSSALIGCFCNFQPMRRRFITNHVIFKPAYDYKFQLKVSHVIYTSPYKYGPAENGRKVAIFIFAPYGLVNTGPVSLLSLFSDFRICLLIRFLLT